MFGTFCDIATNPEANAAAAAFIRSKIKEIVKDPETARKLTPTGLYAKRPLCNEGYYETFNRDNVTLVSIEENPIEAITPAGVRTADGVEHKLDVLVFATGFDAVDGNYRSMDLRGRGGRHINEGWADGPSSYLGVSTHGFPNLFMILGPNGPFTNLPPSIESQVDWISETIRHAEQLGDRNRGTFPGGRGRLDEDLRGDRQHDALPEGRIRGSSAPTSPARRTRLCSTWPASAPTASSSRPSETTAIKGSSSAEGMCPLKGHSHDPHVPDRLVE